MFSSSKAQQCLTVFMNVLQFYFEHLPEKALVLHCIYLKTIMFKPTHLYEGTKVYMHTVVPSIIFNGRPVSNPFFLGTSVNSYTSLFCTYSTLAAVYNIHVPAVWSV